MAATILQGSKVSVSVPFQLTSRQSISSKAPYASSSRSPQPGDISDTSSTSTSIVTSSQPSTKGFGRIRSSLEESLRSAIRSKKAQTPPTDDFATITARQKKGKEKVVSAAPQKEKEKTRMFRKLEPKAIFRRTGHETSSPLPPIPVEKDPVERMRSAGFTSFVTPSMRQGSMSSPSLHLSSQAIPSPKSRPAIPISSSSKSEIHATPTRDRRQNMQPPRQEINSPTTLALRREAPGQITAGANQTPESRHRLTKSAPLAVPSTPPSPDRGNCSDASGSQSPETPTPTRRAHDISSPPDTPTPMSSSGQQLSRISSRKGHASSSHLPLNISPASPISPRASSPVRARPTRAVTPRGLSSASASHLPISPSSPSFSPRRPSVDGGPRRPSIDTSRRVSVEATRRPSVDTPRRASIDTTQSPPESPSPSPRPRPVSPGQRLYMQNRYFNISSASLSGPPNPEYRELVRTASAMLCKEVIKIPPHMSQTETGVKDWEEVKTRTRALARAERVWGKSGGNAGGSSSNFVSPGGSGISASAEERERRLFAESLRDGYVLCQLMNKLRSASVVKPDARDDGVVRMSNITKFLAACSSYGLPEEDLFLQDDLIEATSESLARVARTIIALVKFADVPVVDKSKIIHGQGRKPPPILIPGHGPYQQGAASGRASASTPNLVNQSPTPTSPVKRQPNRPDSPERTVKGVSRVEADSSPTQVTTSVNHDVPYIMPPPRSPLRAKSSKSKRNDETELTSWAKVAASPSRMSLTDSTRASIGDDSVVEQYDPRQSVVSSVMTETSVATEMSSLLDFGRSNGGNNKYGTIRTVTTDLTSEAPSMTRTEGSTIAEELAHKKGIETGAKHHRDRKPNEVALVDLYKVIEEGQDGSSSSSRGKEFERLLASEQSRVAAKLEKAPKVNLGKGMWPNDFMDAFQRPVRTLTPNLPTPEESPKRATPISVPPPRKLAIVGATRLNDEAVSQSHPRRPTHRTRQSIDAPVFGHDGSPDGITSGPRVIPRRRDSTKPSMPGAPRNAVRFSDNDSRVPFPRVASAEPGDDSSSHGNPPNVEEKPRIPRGRFQSDINDSTSRRRVRPKSHDGLGPRPLRSRIESMVNLGAGSANASASDLLARGSEDGSAVHKTLIIREEGKPATHFQLGNCIGRGQFGSVYRALNLNTGQMVAVKRIRLEGLKESEIMTLMREVDLVKSLSHPSIVKYEGMARDADTLSIVLEYAESGSLGQTLKAFGKLNERLVASYVVRILEGLHYLHTNDVVHCDLKAANILTTKHGNVKLSDFGVSLNLRAMEREIKDVAGTPNWMAPEVIELKGPSPKSDIWSLACTVIELLTGRPPYADISNSMAVMYSIVEDAMPPLPPCTPLLQDFLTICFNKDPRRRPNAETLFEHPWLKQNWGIHKELRPQDSIPFLRRVSAELQNVRFRETFDPPEGDAQRGPSPLGRRVSDVSIRGTTADTEISPREHQFVKTTFSKPMVCRVCLLNVKKNAVLCAQCSLIAHSKCATDAPPTCDLRSQLLLYAKYAEQGHTTSVYSNPAEGLRGDLKAPASDVSYVAHSRTSIDSPTPTQSPIPAQPPHPPTAYKFMGFKRGSRQSLSPEPTSPPISSSPPAAAVVKPDVPHRRKVQVLKKLAKDRPHSLSSNSTDPSSLRSAATPAESLSSTSRHGRRSATNSEADTRRSEHSDAARTSQLTARTESVADEATSHGHSYNIPGSLPVETRRNKKREKSPGCSVQ